MLQVTATAGKVRGKLGVCQLVRRWMRDD